MSRGRQLAIKIALPLIATLICLVLVELLARVALGRGTMHLGIEMWKYASKVKQREANREIGHRHRPNAHAFLMGADVKTNSLGLRDDEVAIPKPKGITRIVVLGDSLTFGWGVEQKDTYCEVLERALNASPIKPGAKYEVVNTGVGNTNTSMEYHYFLEQGLKLDPDLLLVGWFINDAEPTPNPNPSWMARNSYAYVFFDSAFDSLLRKSAARQTYREFYSGLYKDEFPGWKTCKTAIQGLGSLVAEKKIPTHVILLPELHTLGANYEFTEIHAKVTTEFQAAKLPVLDTTAAFDASWKPEEFWVSPTDAHPNARAQEIIAKRIEETLRKENWLP